MFRFRFFRTAVVLAIIISVVFPLTSAVYPDVRIRSQSLSTTSVESLTEAFALRAVVSPKHLSNGGAFLRRWIWRRDATPNRQTQPSAQLEEWQEVPAEWAQELRAMERDGRPLQDIPILVRKGAWREIDFHRNIDGTYEAGTGIASWLHMSISVGLQRSVAAQYPLIKVRILPNQSAVYKYRGHGHVSAHLEYMIVEDEIPVIYLPDKIAANSLLSRFAMTVALMHLATGDHRDEKNDSLAVAEWLTQEILRENPDNWTTGKAALGHALLTVARQLRDWRYIQLANSLRAMIELMSSAVLTDDPEESHDLAAQMRQRLARMTAQAFQWIVNDPDLHDAHAHMAAPMPPRHKKNRPALPKSLFEGKVTRPDLIAQVFAALEHHVERDTLSNSRLSFFGRLISQLAFKQLIYLDAPDANVGTLQKRFEQIDLPEFLAERAFDANALGASEHLLGVWRSHRKDVVMNAAIGALYLEAGYPVVLGWFSDCLALRVPEAKFPKAGGDLYPDIENRLGFVFKCKALLQQALTHTTYNSSTGAQYERLEWLGDAVLAVAVWRALMETYPRMEKLGIYHNLWGASQTLIRWARDLGLSALIRHKRSKLEESVEEDVMEAVLAAMFLEDGLNAVQLLINGFIARPAERARIERDPRVENTADAVRTIAPDRRALRTRQGESFDDVFSRAQAAGLPPEIADPRTSEPYPMEREYVQRYREYAYDQLANLAIEFIEQGLIKKPGQSFDAHTLLPLFLSRLADPVDLVPTLIRHLRQPDEKIRNLGKPPYSEERAKEYQRYLRLRAFWREVYIRWSWPAGDREDQRRENVEQFSIDQATQRNAMRVTVWNETASTRGMRDLFADAAGIIAAEDPDYDDEWPIESAIGRSIVFDEKMRGKIRFAVHQKLDRASQVFRQAGQDYVEAKISLSTYESAWGLYARLLQGGYDLPLNGQIYRVPTVSAALWSELVARRTLKPQFIAAVAEMRHRQGWTTDAPIHLTVVTQTVERAAIAFFQRADIKAALKAAGVRQVSVIGTRLETHSFALENFLIIRAPLAKAGRYVFPAQGEPYIGDEKEVAEFGSYGSLFINVQDEKFFSIGAAQPGHADNRRILSTSV